MQKIYACLIGNWVCLNDDPDCVIGGKRLSPSQWYEDNAEIYAPLQRQSADTYYELNYVRIFYRGKDYRINPIFIQVVSE